MFNTKISVLNLLLGLTATTGLFFSACKKDEATAQENITTVEVHLTGPGFDQKFYWNDLDGDGGNAPTIDQIVLPAQTDSIECHLHLYDRSVSPEVDITDEVEAESTEHVFVYAINNLATLLIGNLNNDSAGNRFGLTSTWATGNPGTGTINIRLFHDPTNKNDTNQPGGDVDLDVTFPAKIE